MEVDGQTLGSYIAKRRKVLNISQKELGARIERTETTVANWEAERGDVPFEMLSKLADALEESSPVVLYALAGVFDRVPGGQIVLMLKDLPQHEIDRLASMAEAFVRGSRR